MTVRSRLHNLIQDFLPEGFFWRGPAADRFVDALTDALLPAATFIDGLCDCIFPGTAARSILVQWWNYLEALGCLAIPIDDDKLRAAVLGILGAANADTPAGLAAYIGGFLPFVELTESLPVSTLPRAVPFDLEPTGRILEVWHAPLIDPTETVRCVVRPIVRAGDALRLVSSSATWIHNGPLASDTGFAWTYANGSSLDVERAPGSGQPATETNTIPLTSQHGFIATADAFPLLNPSDAIAGQEFRWTFEKDFGAGAVTITAQQTGSHP